MTPTSREASVRASSKSWARTARCWPRAGRAHAGHRRLLRLRPDRHPEKGERLRVHVIVRTRPKHPGGATLELYDRKTGTTLFAVTPTRILDPSLVTQ